jgi:hypothetical protein
VKNGSQIGVIEPAGSTYFANFAHEKAAMVLSFGVYENHRCHGP